VSKQLNIADGVTHFGTARARASAWSDGDRTLTFGALDERSSRLASALLASGARPGQHVGIMLDNRLEYPEIIAAVSKAGLVMVPLNTHSTATEVGDLLRRAAAFGVITEAKYSTTVGDSFGTYEPQLALQMDDGGDFPSYDAFLNGGSADAKFDSVPETDPFCVSFTGGTTGQPKGVVISHRSRSLTFLNVNIEFGMGPGKRTINATPLYHGAGVAYGYGFMWAGAHVETMRRWDPERLLALVSTHAPDTLFLVPSQLSDLRELGVDRMRAAGFHRIPSIFTSAAPLPEDLKRWSLETFPEVGWSDVYGGTEAGLVTVLRPDDIGRKVRCAGPSWFMTEVRLLDKDKNVVPPGEQGELYSRSPYLFNGYLNDPEQTREVSTEDGFVTAGDVAIMDDEGFYYIVDRAKDMIITGGVNVYPREVEEVLNAHPSVADVAVVGMAHPRWGEEVVALIVTRGQTPMDEAALTRHCQATLSSYKVPKRFIQRETLDRTDTGKLQKASLRAWVERLPQ
jgi:long-chain acyl-CoA synthetase